MRARAKTRSLVPAALLAPLLLALPRAAAHAAFAGETVAFRMPPWVVWMAGALVVALSFALVAAATARGDEATIPYRRTAPRREDSAARLPGGTGVTPLRGVGLLVLALVIANGARPDSASLLPTTALWLGVWVVLPLAAYTAGDLWPRIDPFRALEPLARRLRGARRPLPYPARLGAWPAVVLFLGLVAAEVTGAPWSEDATLLGRAALAYTLLVLLGMTLFGAARWLAEAEVIGRAMRWWHAVSPIAWRDGRPRWRGVTHGLAALPVARLDGVAFTIAVLYGVNHDALLRTALGGRLVAALRHLHVPLPEVVLLAAGFLFFLAAWLVAARAMRNAAEDLATVRATAAGFAASLLPIAAAYHLAHNLPYLWQGLPRLARAALDPLGLGLAPARALPEALPLAVGALPYLAGAQVLAIVVGHLLAVVGAHRIAMASHPSRVQAILAGTPLTLVMVLYTGVGLALLGAKGVAA